jgi:hypothetical protein
MPPLPEVGRVPGQEWSREIKRKLKPEWLGATTSDIIRSPHRTSFCRASPQDRDAQVRNRQRSQKHPLDREKTQKNVELHFAVESQIHSSSMAPQE